MVDGERSSRPEIDGPLGALHVLETLASMRQPAGLPAIMTRTGLSRTRAFRLLQALQDRGFVDHTGRQGYRVGSRSLALASVIGPRPALLQRAGPVLARVAALGYGATLHLRSGDHRVLVLGVKGTQGGASGFLIGERAPLVSGCGGTSILAYLGAADAEQVIARRPPRTRKPGTASLARIRADGYALSFSANHSHLNGIAAPLLDPDDETPLGSIAIAGHDRQLSEVTLRRFSGPLIAACSELAPRLATLLGPNASEHYTALDVTIQDFLANQETPPQAPPFNDTP